jgi:hypothetical protein
MESNAPSRRPSLWEPGFDTAHLAVPILILLLGGLLFYLPPAPIRQARPVPPPPPVIQPTTWLSPVPGTAFAPGQALVVEGLAHPGSVVRLYWYANPLGDPLVVPPDGRWRFQVANLPAGNHTLRVGALVAGRPVWSPEFTLLVVPPEPVKPKVQPKAKTPSKATSKAKAAKSPANPSKAKKNAAKGE